MQFRPRQAHPYIPFHNLLILERHHKPSDFQFVSLSFKELPNNSIHVHTVFPNSSLVQPTTFDPPQDSSIPVHTRKRIEWVGYLKHTNFAFAFAFWFPPLQCFVSTFNGKAMGQVDHLQTPTPFSFSIPFPRKARVSLSISLSCLINTYEVHAYKRVGTQWNASLKFSTAYDSHYDNTPPMIRTSRPITVTAMIRPATPATSDSVDGLFCGRMTVGTSVPSLSSISDDPSVLLPLILPPAFTPLRTQHPLSWIPSTHSTPPAPTKLPRTYARIPYRRRRTGPRPRLR